MDIYQVLHEDHEAVKKLLNQLIQIERPKGNPVKRSALIAKIRDELVPHSRAEEAIFYNSLRSIPSARQLIANSYTEHMEAEAILRAIQTSDVFNITTLSLAKKLKEALEHHIAEEEDQVFPAAQEIFLPEEAELMAAAFIEMKPKVREGNFVQNTVDAVANIMPARFADVLRKFTHTSVPYVVSGGMEAMMDDEKIIGAPKGTRKDLSGTDNSNIH